MQLSLWPCTHYAMLFWMPKPLPCSSDNEKQCPLCCFSLGEQQDILDIRMEFNLVLSLDNQVLWPFTLWSNAKIWEDLKKLKMNPIDNRNLQKMDTFPIGTFHLGHWEDLGAYHTSSSMKSLSSLLLPPPGLHSIMALLTSPWTESIAAKRGPQMKSSHRVLCLVKTLEDHKIYPAVEWSLSGRQKKKKKPPHW